MIQWSVRGRMKRSGGGRLDEREVKLRGEGRVVGCDKERWVKSRVYNSVYSLNIH